MMKVDYQRAVQLRIPKMDAEPDKHFHPTVFICDEYQNFAAVGDNPTGDERFLSISRQPKCITIVATQSLSSLKEALPNEDVAPGIPHENLPHHLRPGETRMRRSCAVRQSIPASVIRFLNPDTMPTSAGSVAGHHRIKDPSPPPSNIKNRRSRCSTSVSSLS